MRELAWRFFFWITPHWLITKWKMYRFRRFAKRHPVEMQRAMMQAIPPHITRRLKSQEELEAWSKETLYFMLHPQAYKDKVARLLRDRKHHSSQIGPQP